MSIRALAPWLLPGCTAALVLAGCSPPINHPADGAPLADAAPGAPPWIVDAHVLVNGLDATNKDCRPGICKHNENTDLTVWKGAIWLVHRTAESQKLGPNSSLHIYRSVDSGKTFTEMATLLAPTVPAGRDLRDPHFYQVGDALYLKALTRLPSTETRDAATDTIPQMSMTTDGTTWSPLAPMGPEMWSFWRIKKQGDTYYSAAYADGDQSVSMFSSKDGLRWTLGKPVYGVAADTPLETELTFLPSGRLLALARVDGTDQELAGDKGRLRTKICWAMPPYDSFSCPDEFMGQRLDGPVTFWWKQRLFVVARKHLGADGRKRTALFEITGTLEGGPLAIKEWGELPSAGDTSYAGVAPIDENRFLVTWYSGDLKLDETWILGMFDATDIWQATLDLAKLQ